MATISFKVSEEEAHAIRARALQDGLTVSEYLRQQAAAPSRPATKVHLLPCPVTGALIFDGSEALPPLTVDATREMLSDFP